MRYFFYLTLVVESYSLCGTGKVDLSGMDPFEVRVNCPGNKDKGGIEMGCVDKQTPGYNGVIQKQKSNIFYINPCGEVNIPNIPECKDTVGAAGIEVTVDLESDNIKTARNCYNLGSVNQRKFSLMDQDNPDEGITAIYSGGSSNNCPRVNGHRKNRTFEVHFHCSLQPNDINRDVDEPGGDDACYYTLQHNSIHACPTYCVTGNSICNGNGICGHHAEPCLCYDGYTGDKCQLKGGPPFTKAPEGFRIAAVLLVVGMLLLGALLGFLLYMWIKLRRLAPVDTEAYSTLTSKFNELGQIT